MPEEPTTEAIIAVAERFLDLIRSGDFSVALKLCDEPMKEALPADKLQETWESVVRQVGKYSKTIGVRKEAHGGHTTVIFSCDFANMALEVKIGLDKDAQITGLFFSPTEKTYDFEDPPYAQLESFTEKDVTFGVDEFTLPGTLSIPNGAGTHPAVVLVHGSGPHDRDETIGPNKPFRDLAWGLASKGIAVLRYVKRSKEHGGKLQETRDERTVEDEVITDALEAVSFLKRLPEIDSNAIFVLGHSLGGMVIPRIGQRDHQIAGVIVMAGTARHLEDIILEQYDYLLSIGDQPADERQAVLTDIRENVQRVKSLELSKDTDSSLLPLGIPASYWLDLRNYDPPQEATRLTMPIMVIQGARDYQSTTTDFSLWQDALSSREKAFCKLYPSLNHLFMHGEGKSVPSEYEEPGHVDEAVVDDVASWVRSIRNG